jgi:nucleoid-associated protein YgaU
LFTTLHPELQELFIRCFVEGHSTPSKRPTTSEWKTALNKAEKALKTCSNDRNHFYYKQLKKCPWCIKMSAQKQVSAQKPLPPPKVSTPSKGWKKLLILAVIAAGIPYMLSTGEFFTSAKNGAWWGESTLEYSTYTVQHGDYLSKIAQKYPGVSVDDIVAANKRLIKKPKHIEPGWKLKIPRQQ